MSTVYLAGHGSWNIKEGGFTTVPKGVCITFYTDSNKNMFTGDMFSLISGKYTGEVRQFYREGSQVPNYTLYPDTQNEPKCRQLIKDRHDKNFGLLMVVNGQTSNLKKLMSIMGQGTNIVWACCRGSELNRVGGRTIGVGGAQGTYGNRDGQGKPDLNGFNYFNPEESNRKLFSEPKNIDMTTVLQYNMKSRRRALGYED